MHFQYVRKLVDQEYPWEISISYMFSFVEIAHNMTVYCGVVKKYRVNSPLAKTAVENHHMTRDGFRILFKAILGKPLDKLVADKIEKAESVRDRILHGKTVSELEKRKAVIDILDYAEALNSAVYDLASFRPFGLLTGFKGRAQSLDKSTSRWVLKGIGLTAS